jgi:hypothetical protein
MPTTFWHGSEWEEPKRIIVPKNYYMKYDQFRETGKLKRQRNRYSSLITSKNVLNHEQAIIIPRYGKNWKLIEEGLNVTWNGIVDDFLYYMNYDERIAEIIFRIFDNSILLRSDTDYRLVRKIRSRGISMLILDYSRDINNVEVAHNIFMNKADALTDLDVVNRKYRCLIQSDEYSMIAELAEWKNIPYKCSWDGFDDIISLLPHSIRTFKFGRRDCRRALLRELIQSKRSGFVYVLLRWYMNYPTLIEVLDEWIERSRMRRVRITDRIKKIIIGCCYDNELDEVQLSEVQSRLDQIETKKVQRSSVVDVDIRQSYMLKWYNYGDDLTCYSQLPTNNENLITLMLHLNLPYMWEDEPDDTFHEQRYLYRDYYRFMSSNFTVKKFNPNSCGVIKLLREGRITIGELKLKSDRNHKNDKAIEILESYIPTNMKSARKC